MAITFYYGSGSPYSWRVFLALEHKQVTFEAKLLSFSAGEHRTPEFAKRNPRLRVPVLTDDEFSLFESAAIVEYLEERFPDQKALFPRDIKTRARARRLIHELDSYLDLHSEALVRELWFKKNPSDRDAKVIEAAREGYAQELQYFESQLESEFFCQDVGAVDYAVYSLLAMLPRFERVQPELGLTRSIPAKLSAWMKRIEALPYFDKTYPPHWRA
jgi:glutathione S-transferase